MTGPLVALVHGTPAAIAPARAGLAQRLPGATTWSILDDRLLVEAGERGGVDDALDARMQRLIAHAVAEGAEAVLLTCSLYGRSAERAAATSPIPVLAADEALFRAALEGGYRTVLVVATLEASRADSAARLSAEAASAAEPPRIDSIVPDGAFAATGDDDGLLASVLAGVLAHRPPADAVVLAQYSLAPIADRLAAALGVPVLSGPQAAADLLRLKLHDQD